MLVWYTAHAKIAAHPDSKLVSDGVEGPLNMHWHIKDLFSCTDDDARYISSRVRQVLKKTGSARNISPGGAGHSPVWWIRDSLPDNIVTVAEWVSANHKTVDPQREGYKPTRTEKRLSEHEAGEDRPAAPVTVTRTEAETGDEMDVETVDVEVEGPVDGGVAPHRKAQQLEYERWTGMALEIITQHGPMTGMEICEILACNPYAIERSDNVVVRACKDMVEDGRLVSRFETVAEQSVRQLDNTKKGGRVARLFAINSEQLARSREEPLRVVEKPEVTVVTPTPTPAMSLADRLRAIADEIGELSELEDLRTMNDLLEEENTQLRAKVLDLEDRLEKVRAAFGA